MVKEITTQSGAADTLALPRTVMVLLFTVVASFHFLILYKNMRNT
jgi:hypothetical protein